MFLNIIKVVFRNLLKQKYYSLINIIGLAVGLAACLFILIYISSEASFDRHHQKAEQIFRVSQTNIWSQEDFQLTGCGPPLAGLLKDNFPEIKEAARVFQPGNYFVSYQEETKQLAAFEEKKIAAIDPSFFNLFDFEWLAGSPENALAEQNAVVITEEIAQKYFGIEEKEFALALGRLLKIDNGTEQKNVKVSGVVRDMPYASHFHFDFMFSMSTFPVVKRFEWSWIWSNCVAYILLEPGTDWQELDQKIKAIPPKYAGSTLQRTMGYSYDEFVKKNGKPWELYLQPLTAIHLKSKGIANPYAYDPVGDMENLYVFGLAAFFIFILACINFMNLATARAAGRAREIGLRKTLGSSKRALIYQFIFESMVISAFAALLALGICELLRPYFNTITLNTFYKPISAYKEIILFLPLATLFTGLAAGTYPAFYLTQFKPVQVLKGKMPTAKGSDKNFRSFLVGLQFAVSSFMVICTALVLSQVQFMSSRELGYERENLMSIRNLEMLGVQEESNGSTLLHFQQAFKQKVVQVSGVKAASISNAVMPRIYSSDYFKLVDSGHRFSLNYVVTDPDFISLLGIPLLHGRDFNEENTANVNKIIINAATARELGYTDGNYEELLGKHISYPDPDNPPFEIIGIMKDTHLEDLSGEIRPLAIFVQGAKLYYISPSNFLTIRIAQNTNLPNLLVQLEKAWDMQGKGAPFQYFFVDDAFNALFMTELRLGKLLGIFTGIAIFIAILGLLGLVAYTAEKKTKEIGIRKVLGASVMEILMLLSKEFTVLVFFGFIVAAPISYYFISNWLQNFSYQIDISASIFIIVLGGGLLLAWIIIALQSLKALNLKAVDALKNE
ncbi:MAG: ABC transporter permease [Bacteroidota bacterium]